MREIITYAPAKLNLYLDVLDKRPDGYHNIETIFEKIDLKDEIIIREKGNSLDVRVENSPDCPSGEGNIVFKALKALFKEGKRNLGLEVVIKKNIPIAAGLGGGSSDAASVLRSVNEKFDFNISDERLFTIAAEIGSDVGFFMMDECFAIGQGKGEKLEKVGLGSSFSHILIKPNISISTAGMYKRINERSKELSPGGMQKTLSSIKNKDVPSLRNSYYNIFEEYLNGYKSVIEKAKRLLEAAGAGPGFLSGSGPSVFSILDEKEEAMKILERIPKEDGIEVFYVQTYKGGIYGNNRSQDIS